MPARRKAKTCSSRAVLERESAEQMLHEFIEKSNSVEERKKSSAEIGGNRGGTVRPAVSARKLGAAIWWLQSPDFWSNNRQMLGLQFDPSFKVSNSSMEGANNFLKQPISSPLIPNLEKQLKQAKAKINKLETEGSLSKNKVEQFLQKLSEEMTAWRSREHEKVRVVVDDMKAKLSREKRHCRRLEMVQSVLVNELADAKLSVKHYLQRCGEERKAREVVEEVCDKLAKDIGEVEKLKTVLKKLWEEIEEERKMLQMGEVWREEGVQMKLADAKVMLEEKHSQMSRIIADLEAFSKLKQLKSRYFYLI